MLHKFMKNKANRQQIVLKLALNSAVGDALLFKQPDVNWNFL